MKALLLKWMAVLLAALLALAPLGLAEDAGWIEPEGAEVPVESWEEEPDVVYDTRVDPEVGLAQDVSDTGLSVEFEEPSAQSESDEIDLPVEEPDQPEPPEGDSEGEGAVLAGEALDPGYYWVAGDTPVYSDAALTCQIGGFTGDSAVYCEAVEADGAVLKVRFDTEDARNQLLDLPAGYISAWNALACSEREAAELAAALAGDARARSADGVPVPCAAYIPLDGELPDYAVMAGENATGLGVSAHSARDIQTFVNAHPAYRSQINIYSVAASDSPYSVGLLSPVNQQSALNLVNQIRYIAGLNADVKLMPEKERAMAATSLVLRLNNGLSHYPARPGVLADPTYDDLYNQGYAGAGSSNIAMGYTVTSALLGGVGATGTNRGYMADADAGNRSTVGHRRWIINPRMGRTIFGANGRFSAMYAHDLSGSGQQTKVAWPAQEMPLQYFSSIDPWSLSYGRTLDASKVTVDVTRARDGKAWHFSEKASDGFFNVENSGYGLKGCVIFLPDGLGDIREGDLFRVSVTDGANNEVTSYAVHFFNLDLSACEPLSQLEVSAFKLEGANAVTWNAEPRATGYYVCRRTPDTLYQIVADIYGETNYVDSAIAPDTTYYYQVYAHNDSITSATAAGKQAVSLHPESVSLNVGSPVSIRAGEKLQLRATVKPDYAQPSLTWTSTRHSVALVDQNGLVTALKKGTAIISAQTENGLVASVKLNVKSAPKPKKVVLDREGKVPLLLGEKLQLNVTFQPEGAFSELSWKSSNKKIAKVNKNGRVTALKAGTVTITVKTKNGKKDSVKVRVVDPTLPTKVKLYANGAAVSSPVQLAEGEKLTLTGMLSPDTAVSKLKWKSSNSKVAKVDQNGLVKARKAGTATVTVKTRNGKTAKLKIRVVK